MSPPGAARVDLSIAAVSRYAGALDVFWVGPDGAIGTTWENPHVDDANWHPTFRYRYLTSHGLVQMPWRPGEPSG